MAALLDMNNEKVTLKYLQQYKVKLSTEQSQYISEMVLTLQDLSNMDFPDEFNELCKALNMSIIQKLKFKTAALNLQSKCSSYTIPLEEYSKTGLSKQQFITELQQFNVEFRKMTECVDNESHSITLKQTANITGTAVGMGVVFGAVGFMIGGPPGASFGYSAGTGIYGTSGVVGTLWDNAKKSTDSGHHYILFEYGPKLQKSYGTFIYEYYMRMEFSSDGYSLHTGHVSKYIEKFGKIDKNSARDKKFVYDCKGINNGIVCVIDTVKSHIPNEDEDETSYMKSGMFATSIWTAFTNKYFGTNMKTSIEYVH